MSAKIKSQVLAQMNPARQSEATLTSILACDTEKLKLQSNDMASPGVIVSIGAAKVFVDGEQLILAVRAVCNLNEQTIKVKVKQ